MATSREIKDGYTSTLQDLTCNNKTLINVLTILAEENNGNAKDIVEAIEEHLAKVRTEVKLPVLYLIDSIIKNVGNPYMAAFSNNIVQIFCSVFNVVDEKTRTEMFKLRQTWDVVLPKNKLYALDVQIKQMDPAWPITATLPNIHLNPKFLKTSAAAIVKKDPVSKPALAPLVTGSAADKATLDMQQKLIIKQKQLLELQQKKLELDLLHTQIKLQEQIKKNNIGSDDNVAAKAKNLLLKPEVAKQLLQDSGELTKQGRGLLNNSTMAPALPRVPPATNSALLPAARPQIRDPRLRRQQPAAAQQQNTVNSNVQLENKANTSNTLDNKVVSNKAVGRGGGEPRFLNNKSDQLPQPQPPKAKVPSRTNIPPPNKQKRPLSPQSNGKGLSKGIGRGGGSKSGSSSSLDSPVKLSKSERSSSKSPSKYKSKANNRSDGKKSLKHMKERKSPLKDSLGFKDVKGLTKNRNYVRRNREPSFSPEPEHHDVDLRLPPPEKQIRLQDDHMDDICMDVDLRLLPPSQIGKKRPSIEAAEVPSAKKTKTEMFNALFGSEDVDLRQLPNVMSSPKESDRPPTPPPPIISTNKPEQQQPPPKKDSAPSKANLDALRAKLANATSKDKIAAKSRFSQPDPQRSQSLDDSASKILISPADEEIIKGGNMTKAQGNALMTRIIAQIENQKLKEAKRKESESEKSLSLNISLQPISDDELEVEPDVRSHDEFPRFDEGNRFRRGSLMGGPMWRGPRRGFPGPRGPIRPPRPGIEPWIRPLNPTPHWRPPFMTPNFNDNLHSEIMDSRSNSPFQLNDANDLTVNCSNQDNTKSINIDGEPRDIIFYNETAIAFMTWEDPREITFQTGSRRVIFDDKESYVLSFNEPYKEVSVNGNKHKVRLGAPTREIYIDGKSYECFFGGPPIAIELHDKLIVLKIEGPPPQVKIGTVRRTDLVAGKINLIIDAKTIVPVYLDARSQKFDIDGKAHTLRFTDGLKTVLINDQPFKVEFGGLPKPITVNDKKHFVRFSVLPRGIKPGHVSIKDMEGCKASLSDNETSQDGFEHIDTAVPPPIIQKKKSRFSDDSPDRNSNSPNNIGNLDSILTNVLAATANLPTNDETTSGYQIDNTHNEVSEPIAANVTTTEVKPPPPAPPILPPSLNINELFQKLVATGIVTSTLPEVPAPVLPTVPMVPITLPSIVIPQSEPVVHHQQQHQQQQQQPQMISPGKTKKHVDMTVKIVDFTKTSSLKMRQPALINMLYSGMQCSSCGMRFPPENSMLYSQHLDWHFRQNRRGKKNIRKATSRRWYYSVSDWNNYEEIEDLEEREKCYFENQQQQMEGGNDDGEEEIEIPSVPADSNVPDPYCEVCKEKFEQFYNEEKEEWHLRMAVRIDDLTYHPLCYEDYQASLVDTTLDESVNQPVDIEHDTNSNGGIPGLEVSDDEDEKLKDELVEIVSIDDVDESVESIAATPKTETKDDVKTEDEDDDDVIINEVQPEQIVVEDYEFQNNVDDDIIPGITVKLEPADDGFTDIENFKIGELKIKTEPETPDESFEDIGQVTTIPEDKPAKPQESLHTELVSTIDGNVELNAGGSQPTAGIAGKIKINISKQLPVIAPKESNNKDIPLDVENTVEPVDPTQPLPPGEEPVQLNLKPALQGVQLKKLPPVNKGSELTGLCSIM